MGSCFFMRRSTEEAHVGEDKAAPLIIFSVRSTRAFNGQREARGSAGGHTVFSALPSLARASGPPRQPGTSRSAFRVLGPPGTRRTPFGLSSTDSFLGISVKALHQAYI